MTKDKVFVKLQYLTPQRFLTALSGILANTKSVWVKNFLIRYFIRRYSVDLAAAQFEDINQYPTFNSFFTRYLKEGHRVISADNTSIASPADGVISQLGDINKEEIFQAKGFYFSLSEILGNDKESFNFVNGKFITIYLSPKDYHRVHMPITGKLRKTIFIPGKLFSVNKVTGEQVPKLFARNERLICYFETAIGTIAIILVGAMLVRSICTVWQENISGTKVITTQYDDTNTVEIKKGEELGHFKMGSTVIILFPTQKIVLNPNLHADSAVLMGEEIAKTL